jgi:hypothetical protein
MNVNDVNEVITIFSNLIKVLKKKLKSLQFIGLQILVFDSIENFKFLTFRSFA